MKTIRMPKESLAKWLAALRSGKYKQGMYALETPDGGYCCLGVLQHCLDGGVERRVDGGSKGLPSLHWLRLHNIKFVERDVLENVVPFLPTLNARAAGANDLGVPFDKIADAIEACAEGV